MNSRYPKSVLFYLVCIPIAAIPWAAILVLLYQGEIGSAIIGAFAFIFWLPWLPGLLKDVFDGRQGHGDEPP